MKSCLTLLGVSLLVFSLTSFKEAAAAAPQTSGLESGDQLFEKGRASARTGGGVVNGRRP